MRRNVPNHDLIVEPGVQNPDERRKASDGSLAADGYQTLQRADPETQLERSGLGEPVSVFPKRWLRSQYY